jgi:hypothetical protein
MPDASIVCGADSTGMVTQEIIDNVHAQYGAMPTFWGRYFKKPGDTDPGDDQYKFKKENAILQKNGIKLLPIARQTNHVGGTEDLGKTDGKNNAQAIVEALGADYLIQSGPELLVFLDTEPERSGPALSYDYYVGWASALIAEGLLLTSNKVRFRPGLYLNSSGQEANGPAAARVLAKVAEEAGSNSIDPYLVCRAVWAARYGGRTPVSSVPVWSDEETRLPELPDASLVVAWQWAEAEDNIPQLPIDPNIINPSCSDELLNHLVVPPKPSLFQRLIYQLFG